MQRFIARCWNISHLIAFIVSRKNWLRRKILSGEILRVPIKKKKKNGVGIYFDFYKISFCRFSHGKKNLKFIARSLYTLVRDTVQKRAIVVDGKYIVYTEQRFLKYFKRKTILSRVPLKRFLINFDWTYCINI